MAAIVIIIPGGGKAAHIMAAMITIIVIGVPIDDTSGRLGERGLPEPGLSPGAVRGLTEIDPYSVFVLLGQNNYTKLSLRLDAAVCID